MSDTTYFQLIVWDCPPEDRAALAAVMTDIGGKGSWDLVDYHDGADPTVRPGSECDRDLPWRLNIEEVRCGTAGDVDTDAMIGAAPEATWEFWEDPEYEWLGDWHGYTPSAGELGGDCDSDGNVVIDVGGALAALEARWGSGWRSVSAWVAMNAVFPEQVFHEIRFKGCAAEAARAQALPAGSAT